MDACHVDTWQHLVNGQQTKPGELSSVAVGSLDGSLYTPPLTTLACAGRSFACHSNQ